MNSLLIAALTAAPEKIPDLKPPRGVIPPGFWESYGWLAVLLAGVTLLVVSAVIHRLRRPKPVIVPTPAQIARRELERLRAHADDPEAIAAIARALRHFVVSKFRLAGPGLTADEIAAQVPTDPGLAAEVHLFLEQCDTANFAPASAHPNAVTMIGEAGRLIGVIEQQTPPALPVQALVAR